MKYKRFILAFVSLLSFGVFAGTLEAQHGVVTTPIGTGDDFGYSIKVQDDGKIVVGGYYETATYRDFVALRFHADLTLDSSFGTGGIAPHDIWGNDNSESLIIQPDGKILLGGAINVGSDMGCCDEFAVARLNTDGSDDLPFGDETPDAGHITINIGSSWDWGRRATLPRRAFAWAARARRARRPSSPHAPSPCGCPPRRAPLRRPWCVRVPRVSCSGPIASIVT